MGIRFDHTLLHCLGKQASTGFLAEIPPRPYGSGGYQGPVPGGGSA